MNWISSDFSFLYSSFLIHWRWNFPIRLKTLLRISFIFHFSLIILLSWQSLMHNFIITLFILSLFIINSRSFSLNFLFLDSIFFIRKRISENFLMLYRNLLLILYVLLIIAFYFVIIWSKWILLLFYISFWSWLIVYSIHGRS